MAPTPSNATVPWTDHGIPGLVCTQTRWSSLVLFFLGNYVAHCATIMSYPAETWTERAVAITGALLFPSSGLRRAVGAIRRRPRLRPLNSIQRALASGAMCMVVRTKDWEPRTGEIIRNLRSNVVGIHCKQNLRDCSLMILSRNLLQIQGTTSYNSTDGTW
jgi:hypothetical protein